MNLVFDLPRLSAQPLGMQVYIENVVGSIIEESPNDWKFSLLSDGLRGKSEHFERLAKIDAEHRADWRFPGIPQSLQSRLVSGMNFHSSKKELIGADIVHSFSALPLPTGLKQLVVTVQDLIPLRLGEGGEKFVRKARLNWERLLPTASKIITISEFCKNEIVDILGIEPHKISVIVNGVNAEHFKRLPPEKFGEADERLRNLGISQPYLLHVGGCAERKNAARIVDAFNILKAKHGLPHCLIFAGANQVLTDLAARISASPYKDQIATLPYLPKPDALLLLQRADVLIFPSTYEGFGLPPLEAMSCGIPVALSTAASLPEVGGDAVSYFDPLNVEEIAIATWRLIEDRSFREQCVTAGLQRSKQFRWKRNAQETLELYEEVLSNG